ncbi:NADP-dependent isocitrate dehydrogenase [Methylacidimicrobium sp. B4]|uniref:NADP-dependent isocitrate dehydrogenase n=1 Tax=Methylacidimicrobium sp. B4 TaxID=2796139 RepID=UPI001A8E1693|nr:NADP-dependent isocitrate dehydrogenase [Methylacidimicrobium sp. B4]QSR84476.1 NADP-dependent isocitrate dehydrogenase [Methylacidimicrobium sp. B4]
MSKVPVTVAYGDGIGPEIMAATLAVLEAAGAELELETIEIGKEVYLRGNSSGIETKSWESLQRTKVFLKAPITTPQGGGYKSLNVTVRKALGLYANIRPCMSYVPFVESKHPGLDVVIVRENEEDLYGGIEHRQSVDSFQCLKIMTRPGTERLIRYAFEYARSYRRKKVTCFTKDNIMKLTDGMFHRVFEEVGAQYPEIEKEHWIVDIGAAKLADTPQIFDLVVVPNLYGDILSDVVAQIAGSVGLAGSSNIGARYAMFEAIHGSAPRRAGQNLANPSGLLLAAVQMLLHIGQRGVAERVHNAWLRTLEEGVHTYDIFRAGKSRQKVGTREFGLAVIANLGAVPETLAPVQYGEDGLNPRSDFPYHRPEERKVLVGVDIFAEFSGRVEELAAALREVGRQAVALESIANRGMSVWPFGLGETLLAGPFQCRLLAKDRSLGLSQRAIVELLGSVEAAGIEFTKAELLYTFNGAEGFSRSQGA